MLLWDRHALCGMHSVLHSTLYGSLLAIVIQHFADCDCHSISVPCPQDCIFIGQLQRDKEVTKYNQAVTCTYFLFSPFSYTLPHSQHDRCRRGVTHRVATVKGMLKTRGTDTPPSKSPHLVVFVGR